MELFRTSKRRGKVEATESDDATATAATQLQAAARGRAARLQFGMRRVKNTVAHAIDVVDGVIDEVEGRGASIGKAAQRRAKNYAKGIVFDEIGDWGRAACQWARERQAAIAAVCVAALLIFTLGCLVFEDGVRTYQEIRTCGRRWSLYSPRRISILYPRTQRPRS